MSHLTRAQPDTTWVRGYKPTGADLKKIDTNTWKSINGDEGGVWAPSTPIIIGGQGIILAGPSTISAASSYVQSSSTNPIIFGKDTLDDYFALDTNHTYRTRSIKEKIIEVFAPNLETEVKAYSAHGIQTVRTGARFFASIGMYNGARIDSVEFRLTVGEVHTFFPSSMPSFRVIAIDANGVFIPLRLADSTTNVDGFISMPSPVLGDIWGSNAIWVFTYVCNNTHIMDSSLYTYMAEIVDESGTNAWITTGNSYLSTTVNCSQITIFDGRN